MPVLTEVESPAAKIARLEHELRAARDRALVAEDQLRRVHVAVRTYKEKQLAARASSAAQAAIAADKSQAESNGLYKSWAVNDPSLDERLDDYLSSDFEPDRSRDWMLNG